MKTSYTQLTGFLAGMLAAATVFAQATPPAPPATQPSDPSAASSPHQRATTKSPSGEASTSPSAASDTATPHQKQAMKKKHKKKGHTATPNP
jgi:hypothetical protein